MVFEIQLTLPGRQARVIPDPGLQLIKEGAGKGLPDSRQSGNALFHPPGGFEHISGLTAAAVTVSVRDKNIVVDFLLLITLPSADQRIRMKHAIVGGKEILNRLANAKSSNQMGQDFCSVNAPPQESIVGHLIELVPGQLGGHKILNPADLHDLRQCAGIAEYVRKPEDPIIHAEFFPKESLAVKELADQAFTARQIGIRLDPHAALGLPASFLHFFPDSFHQFRMPFLHELVQLGLAGHEAVIRILVHQLQHRRKGPAGLFPGLGYSPPPGHIDMRVPYAGGDHLVLSRQLLIQMLPDIASCFPKAFIIII